MQLLDYLITGKLGEGGTGTVYRAQDRRQGRTVALKVTHRGAPAHREAHALRLTHPHILTPERLEVLEDGRLLLVMPFLGGRTLEKFLVPLPLSQALGIVRQAATGLAYAHAQGVLHCDLKPANLMLSAGHLRILDFGLSQLLDNPEEGVRGTLEYLSPEAARGQQPTPQSDLWSLGVVFYELLTGRSPFAAPSVPETLRNLAEAEPEPVTQLRPALPPDLDTVLTRLLSKDGGPRYEGATALLDDLAALEAGGPLAPFRSAACGPSRAAPTEVVRALPPRPDLLVGRDDERALLSLYLGDPECRLLTLQGLGGVGKTHLGLWVAHEQPNFRYVHGAELAATAPGGFVATLARALGVDGEGLGGVKDTIGGRSQLLLLDNVEHLTAQRSVLEALLAACPGLVLFVTSRVRLGLDAEWVVPLQGLSFPQTPPPPGEALGYGALALFAHKAPRPLDLPRDLKGVVDICRGLEGHPLGISLAAALLKGRPVAEVAAQLRRSLAALKQGTGRHRSLEAVFRGSYRLLTGAQKELLQKLTLFEGGFEEAAAAAVIGTDPGRARERLAELLDRSLLGRTLEGRYLQHPVVAQLSRDLLPAPAEAARVRYREHYLAELRRLDAALRGVGRGAALAALGRDAANLSAALRLETGELTAGLAEPLRAFYTHSGRYGEGLELFSGARSPYARVCAGWFALLLGELEEAQARVVPLLRAADPRVRLVALTTWAGVLARQHDPEQARTVSREALALARQLDDPPMISASLSNLAVLAEVLGNPSEAVVYYQQSLSFSEAAQNNPQTLTTLNNLADLYLSSGAVAEAKVLLQRALLLSEKSGLTRMKPLLQGNFGLCLYAQGDYANAEGALLESYGALLDRGDKALAAKVQAYLGQTYAAQGRLEEAHGCLRASLARAAELGDSEARLCVLVRFAELLAGRDPALGAALAALVCRHPAAEPADRRLAEALAGGVGADPPPAASTDDRAVEALLEADTLDGAVAALRQVLNPGASA